MIKKNDEYHYGIFHVKGDEAATGRGGGPIVN
jgi:hypothetical protein